MNNLDTLNKRILASVVQLLEARNHYQQGEEKK